MVTVPSAATLAAVCQGVDQPMPSGPIVLRPRIDPAKTRLKLSDRLPGVARESSVADARNGDRGPKESLACWTAKLQSLDTSVTFSPRLPK